MSQPKPLPEFDADACRVPFPEAVQARGRALFEDGLVRLREQTDADTFEARIPFFRRHHTVWMQKHPDGGLEHGCTCPHTANTGEGCEHLYGLLLAAEAQLREQAAGEQAAGEQAAGEQAAGEQAAGAPEAPRLLYAVEPGTGPLRVSLLREGPKGPEPQPVDAALLAADLEEPHTRALKLLAPAAGGRVSLLEGGGFAAREGPWEIPSGQLGPLLSELARTGGLRLRGSAGRLHPLSWNPAAACHLTLRVEGSGADTLLRGWLVSGERSVRLDKVPVLVPGAPVAVVGRELVPVETFGAWDWLQLLRHRPQHLGTGGEAALRVLARLGRQGPLPRLWLAGAEGPLPLQEARPRGRLDVRSEGELLSVRVRVLYGSQPLVPGSGGALLWEPGTAMQVLRDGPAEAALAVRPARGPVSPHPEQGDRYVLDPRGLPELARELMEEGWDVALDGRPLRRTTGRAFRSAPGAGFVELTGGARYGELEAPVTAVLEALERGRATVPLPDGSLGLVPADWPPSLRRLLELGRSKGGALRFHPAHETLLADAAGLTPTGSHRNLRDALARLGAPEAADPGSSFAGTLAPYQRTGLGWLRRLRESDLGGCLADDMGLGKTVQVAALLGDLLEEPLRPGALVVAPRSVLGNWKAELERFLPGCEPLVYTGSGRKALHDRIPGEAVVLTTYGTLRQDAETLSGIRFQAVILDEAQAVKNPDSVTARAARGLQGELRLALSGTPVENHQGDLWSLMEFANPGLLGSRKRFMAAVEDPEGDGARLHARVLGPLILRRTKEEVAPELPDRTEQVLQAPLAAEQAELYEGLRRAAHRGLGDRAAGARGGLQVLEALLRLRQAACHPGLVDPELAGAESGKLELLLARLQEVLDSGHKALVFSQFAAFLRLVQGAVEAAGWPHGYMDGATRNREAVVRRFQEDRDCPLLLLSLKVGGLGLNLTAADYVFLLDPWWNPAAESQAVDRAHRIGRRGGVMAYRIVAAGTIEEKVLALQARKRAVADALLAGTGTTLRDLTQEDLRMLLGA